MLCPGCGGTRALAFLLRGDLQAALRANALVVMLLLPGAAFGLSCYRAAFREGGFAWPQVPRWAVAGLAGTALGFTVVRNIL